MTNYLQHQNCKPAPTAANPSHLRSTPRQDVWHLHTRRLNPVRILANVARSAERTATSTTGPSAQLTRRRTRQPKEHITMT